MNVRIAIDDALLERLIPTFYARVRKDPFIGPVFNNAVHDWNDHLEKLIAFWSSVMLTSGRYKGNPMAAHLRQARAITPPMFDRWLELWAEVTNELMEPEAAAAMQEKAGRISESLKLALYFRMPNGPTPVRAPASALPEGD